MIEGQPKGVILGLVPSRAYTKDQASVAHFVKGHCHLCKNRRMPEGVARHQGANLYPTRRFRQRRQHGPTFPDSPRRLTRITIEEMISKPDTIKTIRLRLLRDRSDRIIGTWLVVFALVREKDHQ